MEERKREEKEGGRGREEGGRERERGEREGREELNNRNRRK